MERTIDLNIKLDKEAGRMTVTVMEPESGYTGNGTFPYDMDQKDQDEFDRQLGEEIRSWISCWKDQLDDI